ncbi:MAG: hypothetical protein ACP5EP_13230, partial [Acidobacteriaceae bacterium]
RPLITVMAPPPQMRAAVTEPGPPTVLILRNGFSALATSYWFENGERIHYIDEDGAAFSFPIEQLDLTRTVEANRKRGVDFTIRTAEY